MPPPKTRGGNKTRRRLRPAPKSAARPAGKAARLLPGLGVLALVAAWLALLGALSSGVVNWNDVLEIDTMRPWLKFRDLGQGGKFLGGWEKALMVWIPSVAALWGAFALGVDFRVATLLFPLFLAGLSAGGWILVCDRLFGKSPARRAFVLLLHSLPLLVVSRGELDLFYPHIVHGWRGGTWTLTPWLLWLALRALEAPDGRRSAPFLLALWALLVGGAASDLAVVAWFAVPAAGVALLLPPLGMTTWRRALWMIFALAAAVPVGRALENPALFLADFLAEESGEKGPGGLFRLAPAHAVQVGGVVFHLLKKFVARNPLEAVVWAAFVCVAAARLRVALSGGGRKFRNVFPLFSVPAERRQVFVALYVPAAMLLPLLATLTRTQFGEQLDPGKIHFSSHRYFLPLFYFPLFIGWALLPWSEKFGGGRAAARLIPAGCALVLALSAPRAFSIAGDGLDPYRSAFHKCFAENARKFGWSGGLAHVWAVPHLRANPSAGIERLLPVAVLRDNAGQAEIVGDPSYFNHHWFSGEFQFVALNGFQGRVFHTIPSVAEKGCPTGRAAECAYPGHFNRIVDEAPVRAEFGEPDAVVECEGFGFYHYDPPLRFDFARFDRGEIKYGPGRLSYELANQPISRGRL